jgi:uncharacterized repeat protein (TIGR01451 family)
VSCNYAFSPGGLAWAVYFPDPIQLGQSNPIDPTTGFQRGNTFGTSVPAVLEFNAAVSFVAGKGGIPPQTLPGPSYLFAGLLPPALVGPVCAGMVWKLDYSLDGVIPLATTSAGPVRFAQVGPVFGPPLAGTFPTVGPFSKKLSGPGISLPAIPPGHALTLTITIIMYAQGDDSPEFEGDPDIRPELAAPAELVLPPVAQTNLAANGFHFFLQGDPYYYYEIQSSSNLVDWLPMQTLLLTSPQAEIVDAPANGRARFYRASQLLGGPWGTNLVVSAAAGAHGSLTPSNTIPCTTGSNLTFTATADTNYAVSQWLVNGVVAAEEVTSFTLTNVQAFYTAVKATFQPANDLAVALDAPTNPVVVGIPLTYTVTVTNNAPSTSHNVIITNLLSDATSLLSVNSSQGTIMQSGNSVVGFLGDISPHGQATLTVQVSPARATNLLDEVSVAGDDPEPNTKNNYDAAINVALEVPTITRQPDSQTAPAGTNLAFSVIATNSLPIQSGWNFEGLGLAFQTNSPGTLMYQWQFNGTNILAATNQTLTLTAVTTNQSGLYRVLVSNAATNAVSDAASLTVNP